METTAPARFAERHFIFAKTWTFIGWLLRCPLEGQICTGAKATAIWASRAIRLTSFFLPLRWGLRISDLEVTCNFHVPAGGSVLV